MRKSDFSSFEWYAVWLDFPLCRAVRTCEMMECFSSLRIHDRTRRAYVYDNWYERIYGCCWWTVLRATCPRAISWNNIALCRHGAWVQRESFEIPLLPSHLPVYTKLFRKEGAKKPPPPHQKRDLHFQEGSAIAPPMRWVWTCLFHFLWLECTLHVLLAARSDKLWTTMWSLRTTFCLQIMPQVWINYDNPLLTDIIG